MIETARLIIRPLTYEQLIKYAQCDNSLELELMVHPGSRTISPELKEALELVMLPNVANPANNYLFWTLWTAISKADNKMVGDLGIFGEPNEEGAIEIGYGTYDEFQGKGFMTEVVGGIIGWATTQPTIKAITASTDKNNKASFSVLEKNQFVKVGENENQYNWKLIFLL